MVLAPRRSQIHSGSLSTRLIRNRRLAGASAVALITFSVFLIMAARQFINQSPGWEPLPRRVARAFEHNCVNDDESDEDHLSPRNTIRALLALDVTIAGEILSETVGVISRPADTRVDIVSSSFLRFN